MEENLLRVAERVIESAKSEIYLNLKFMWLALGHLTFTVEEGDSLPQTDGKRVTVGGEYLIRNYQKNHKKINRAAVHVAVHCIFRHFARGRGEDPALWDLATDIFTAETLDGFRLPFLSDEKEGEREKVYEELKKDLPLFSAETVYKRLLSLSAKGRPLPPREPFMEDGHDLWQRDLLDGGGREEAETAEEEWQEIAGKILADLQFFHQGGGEAMQKKLKADARKKLSYRAFLRKMLTPRETLKEDPEEFDYVFYSYGFSLYGNMPLIEQLEYTEENALSTLVVVIDTSGSTFQDLVQKFLNQTYAAIEETAAGKFHLRVIQCDEQVRREDVVEDLASLSSLTENFTLVGGGGTDFRPAFRYIDELIEKGQVPNLKGVLYFTDGKGIYPKTARPYPTAFVFYDESYEDKNVPPWAMKLIVGEKEITAK